MSGIDFWIFLRYEAAAMSNVPQRIDCGTRLSQEPWAPELCPRCSLQFALAVETLCVDEPVSCGG